MPGARDTPSYTHVVLFVTVVVAVFALILASKVMIVVPKDSVFVVERLGAYRATLTPGLHFIAPFIDRIAYRHSMLPKFEQFTDHAISRDNVPFSITSAFRWEIAEPRRATYATHDLHAFVTGVVRAQQREWVANHSSDDVRAATRQLEADVARAATSAAESAGVRIVEMTVQQVERG